MSGLSGILGRLPEGRWRDGLGAATHLLRHRGPDGQGFLLYRSDTGSVNIAAEADALPGDAGTAPAVCFGHRLMVLPGPESGSAQPASSDDGRYHLILDGEILNADDLRMELGDLGVQCRSSSDTELLLRGFALFGSDLLPRLRGMFALALLDTRERTVLLARDQFGIRPLYYAPLDGALAFASEIRALLAVPGVSRRVHPGRLYAFIDHLDTDDAEATMFAGVRQLLPGTCARIALDAPTAVKLERYWAPTIVPGPDESFERSAERFRAVFLDGMRLHLRGDGPVGVALSGGLDSSAVTVATGFLTKKQRPLHSFTFVPTDGAVSEAPYARAATAAAGGTWHGVEVAAADLEREYQALILDHGEPFHGPTIYAQRRVFQVARDAGVKVLLEGQGSDEFLAGYDRYWTSRALSLIRAGRLDSAARLASNLGPIRGALLLRSAFRMGLSGATQTRLRHLRYGSRGTDGATRSEWFESRGVFPEPEWRPVGRSCMHEHSIHTLIGNPMQALLRYGDRNAMTFSLENRVPFLHVPLVELAFSLPESHLLRFDGTRKAVLRRAMADLIPGEVLNRTDKVGFATPVVGWLRELRPWVERQLARGGELPCFDGVALRKHWEGLLAGRRADPLSVWRCIGLVLWADAYGVSFD